MNEKSFSVDDRQRRHIEATAQCTEALEKIGRSYGETIMRRLLAGEFAVEDIDDRVDRIVLIFRRFLRENGVCDHDVEVACGVLFGAIVKEGKMIAQLLPITASETIQ